MSQFRPVGGVGEAKVGHTEQFRANYDNVYREDPRIAWKAAAEAKAKAAHEKERRGKCLATKNDGGLCGAYRVEGLDYCVGHLRKFGLLEGGVNEEERPDLSHSDSG